MPLSHQANDPRAGRGVEKVSRKFSKEDLLATTREAMVKVWEESGMNAVDTDLFTVVTR